jgi:aromatic ring-cleaving dioxygenase
MTDPATQLMKIDGYHAHVYYNTETRQRAQRLRDTIASTLGVEVRGIERRAEGSPPGSAISVHVYDAAV